MSSTGSNRIQLPSAFEQRIEQQFPDENENFLQALNRDPAVSIRLHPLKVKTPETLLTYYMNVVNTSATPIPWTNNGYFLSRRPSFTHDPHLHAGCYYVQEASSMFLEKVLQTPEIHDHCQIILDACAAPGGKTTLLSASFPDALVVANEVIRSRIPALLHNTMRWGVGNTVVSHSETHRIKQLSGFFDLILADVPCSGEGLFRKNPESRQEWTEDKAHHCSLRQRAIISDLWDALRPGGFLIYTTCTFNPEENERNMAWLLEQTGGSCLRLPFSQKPGCYFLDQVTANNDNQSLDYDRIRVLDTSGIIGYAFHPHLTRGEGFFLSVIQKPQNALHPFSSKFAFRARNLEEPGPRIVQEAASWLTVDDSRWFRIKERIYRHSPQHFGALQTLASALPIRYAGTEVAKIAGNKLKPSPALALDIHLNKKAFPLLDCTMEESLDFLRCASLSVPGPDKGWYLAEHNGFPLGWLKHVGNRMNNAHPKEWRIRQ